MQAMSEMPTGGQGSQGGVLLTPARRGAPSKLGSRGDGRRVGERARASVVRRTQEGPARGRQARAGITNGQIVKEGVRDLEDQE